MNRNHEIALLLVPFASEQNVAIANYSSRQLENETHLVDDTTFCEAKFLDGKKEMILCSVT